MTPLYELKAQFFKTLGHPTRVRVLELLSTREMSVAELMTQIGIEASNLSQQLAVLRRFGLVTTRRQGNNVFYSLSSPELAELFAVARRFLTARLNEQVDMLRGLEADAALAAKVTPAPARRRAR